MSHPEQLAWVERCVKEHSLADEPLVYEVGSLNVNGSPRGLFGAGEYVGFDCVAGPGVDVVVPHGFSNQRVYQLAKANVIVCCEVLEHDPNAKETVHAMMQCLAPGGCLIITAAGPNRPEHGTRRTGAVWGPNPDYYRNVTLADLRRWTELDGFWASREYEENADPSDVYFCGIAR